MGWDNNTFPKADDPKTVGWMISYWRIVKCDSGCKNGYGLESRQFEHLEKFKSEEEARKVLKHFAEQKRASGKQDSIKGLTLFLSKVVVAEFISGIDGNIITEENNGLGK